VRRVEKICRNCPRFEVKRYSEANWRDTADVKKFPSDSSYPAEIAARFDDNKDMGRYICRGFSHYVWREEFFDSPVPKECPMHLEYLMYYQ